MPTPKFDMFAGFLVEEQTIQATTMPTASASCDKKIFQYIGETTSDYTNGYFYKCVENEDYVPANVTISQTAGLSMGSFTIDQDKFIAKVNNTAGTYKYEFKGYPSVISVTDNDTSTTLSFNRYSTIDGSGYYGWVTNDNLVLFTTTKTPTASSVFYTVGSGTAPVEANYTYVSTTTRDTSRMVNGYWAVKNTEAEIPNFQEEYGIGNDQAAFIGVQISVTYTLASGNAYSWTRIDVQPSGGSTGGIEYTDLHATSPITYNNTNGTYGVLTATTSNLGVVKPDGTTIAINGNGVISSTGAKLYTLDNLSITSTNVDIRTLVQAIVAKNLPIGSIVTGSVQLTDAPADNATDAMVEIVSYQLTEGSSTDTIYDITFNSRVESPYQWHAEYWVSHPTADVGWSSAPLAFYNMPTASATYATNGGKIAQYVGPGDGIHVTGKFYKCQEVTPVTTPATYEWVLIHVEPVGSSNDFGIVKVDNSSIIANSGVISANKATGNYSVSFVGNPATTTSALNVGANSTAHGWYATALGCDAVVGDSANDVRVPGAIQLGRGSNTEAGTFKVGLSTDGTTWNDYKLIGADGKVPNDMLNISTTSQLGVVKPDGSTITISDGVISSVGTYTKPSDGIPKTDLASAVRSSLNKADYALQPSSIVDNLQNTSTTSTVSAKQSSMMYATKQEYITKDQETLVFNNKKTMFVEREAYPTMSNLPFGSNTTVMQFYGGTTSHPGLCQVMFSNGRTCEITSDGTTAINLNFNASGSIYYHYFDGVEWAYIEYTSRTISLKPLVIKDIVTNTPANLTVESSLNYSIHTDLWKGETLSYGGNITSARIGGSLYRFTPPTYVTTVNGDSGAITDIATVQEVNAKQDTLVSGTNIKTINGNSILGSGNLVIESGGISAVSHDTTLTGDGTSSSPLGVVTSQFATASQGALADTSIQPNDNISELTNDSGFITNSVNNLTNYTTTTNMNTLLSGKEETSNKVTSISSSSTNTQYPSAKCVYDLVGNIEATLQAIRGV